MPAIDDAVKAMDQLHDKHSSKFMNLFTGKIGKFWTEAPVQKELFPVTKYRNHLVFACEDGKPVSVEAFQTRKAAREYRAQKLGAKPVELTGGKAVLPVVKGRNASGLKVERTYILAKVGTDYEKKLSDMLPKTVAHKRPPKQKTHQLDMFR